MVGFEWSDNLCFHRCSANSLVERGTTESVNLTTYTGIRGAARDMRVPPVPRNRSLLLCCGRPPNEKPPHIAEDAFMVLTVSSDAAITRSMAPTAYVPISSSFAAWINWFT